MFSILLFSLAMVLLYNTAEPILYLKNKVSNLLDEDGKLYKLINCEVCSSFHLGWVTALLYSYIPMFLIVGVYTYCMVYIFCVIKFNLEK